MSHIRILTIHGHFEYLLPLLYAFHRHSMHACAVVVIIRIM